LKKFKLTLKFTQDDMMARAFKFEVGKSGSWQFKLKFTQLALQREVGKLTASGDWQALA